MIVFLSGECIDLIDAFRCECVVGFFGLLCQEDGDQCASNPCLYNGTCVDLVKAYRCECQSGLSGDSCQIDVIDECSSNPCRNGGKLSLSK